MAQVAPAQGLTPAYDVKENNYNGGESQKSENANKSATNPTTPKPVKSSSDNNPSKQPVPVGDYGPAKNHHGYPVKVPEYPPDYSSATNGAHGNMMIINTQPTVHQTTIIHHYHVEPTNYMVLAIFTLVCCNVLLGGVAIAFSLLSSSAYNDGDIDGARSKGKISLAISVAGITITVVTLISVSIYLIVVLTR